MSILSHLFKLRDNANKAKNPGDEEKPFLEHLDDLRKMIMKIIITLLVTTTLAFVFNKQLLDIVNYPLASANIPEVARKATSVIKPTEAFTVTLKICFYAGIIASFPLLLLFIGEFVFPGLNEREKKLIVPTLLAGSLLFIGGVLFAYYGVNRRALEFFYHFGKDRGIEFDLRFQYYVGFITQLTLVFGLCFELPVIVMAFVKLELLSYKLMKDTRSYAIVIIFIVSALITPTTDVFTLSLLAGPMIVLYEMCIWMAYLIEKKRKRAEEAELAADRERLARLTAERKAAAEKSAALEADAAASGSSPATDTLPVPQPRTETREFRYDPDNAIPHHGGDTSGETAPLAESQASSVDKSFDHGADAPESPPADAPAEEFLAHDDPDTLHHHDDPAGHGDDVWHADPDPYHHTGHHDHYHDSYYSGPTAELKRMLREELKDELKGEIKAEVRDELLVILRKELGINLTPDEP